MNDKLTPEDKLMKAIYGKPLSQMTVDEMKEAKVNLAARHYRSKHDYMAVYAEDAFKAGAKWMQEEIEMSQKAQKMIAEVEERAIEEQTKDAPILTMELADKIEAGVNEVLKDICGEMPRPIIMTIAVVVLSAFTGMPVSPKAFDKEG